jgi:alkanesulfonate monooxygenase SsuD/methylene tetrahydromethanopterin reductase-like flavin-dependent oxidoreductase (luciferase family)
VRGLLAGERLAASRLGGERPLRLAVDPHPQIPVHLAALGPRAVRVAGELADAWYPFLLPRCGLQDGIAVLRDSAGRVGRPVPLVSPGVPVAVAADPSIARATAAWWVATYLTAMGPGYAHALRRHGFGAAVDAVLEANPTGRTTDVPPHADVLLDELTVRGDGAAARAGIDAWYAAGAELPVVVLPPGRPVAELEYALEELSPSRRLGSDATPRQVATAGRRDLVLADR